MSAPRVEDFEVFAAMWFGLLREYESVPARIDEDALDRLIAMGRADEYEAEARMFAYRRVLVRAAKARGDGKKLGPPSPRARRDSLIRWLMMVAREHGHRRGAVGIIAKAAGIDRTRVHQILREV